MDCPGCGHENRDQAKFCEECGLSFRHSCSSCGAELRPKAKFCDECGKPAHGPPVAAAAREPRSYTPKHLAEKILTSRSALEGERKQVTVLFADVKGSVALSQGIDPETLHRIMDRFFTILADGVHRFEGTVNQYTGDGIMALFGAPIAHEDHARRACYAALHLRDELRRYADELRLNQGLNFSVRMGLNSGEVVVGKIGDDLRMDYTAQGHTVGLAARMEQIAESGHVYLTQQAARLVEGFFRLRDLGPLAIKGVQDPLRVYELEGIGALRTRLEVSRARGFSRFVGRSHEMQVLETALAQALDGHGQVVGVVGEAGIGKSRLCLEFADRLRARGTPVYEAHCPAHGKTLPFVAALELFRAYFGIAEQESDAEARKKIAGTLILLDQGFHDVLPLVFEFLGVPDPERPVPRMDPEARQRQLFAFLRQLVERRSARELAVLLIDDVHWIDAASDAFLAQLVEAVSGTRTLLLVNFRPEYGAPWMERSYYQQMPLLPLTPQGTEELLADLLGHDPSLAGLANRIADRTGGNPFFIEEVVQSLVESGSLMGTPGMYQLAQPVEALAIPATVQVVLAARIDRLAEQEKQLIQTASVIGRRFSEPILKAVAGLPENELAACLSALKRAEFIYEEALYPEAVYVFKHALTQEVAYHSQLTERRTRVHAAVARTVTELYPDRLEEQAALIAHHWEEAGEALEAARWHSRAAEWAGTSHVAEALGHWRKVEALVASVSESKESLELALAACTAMLDLGWRLGLTDDEAAELFAKGRELASSASDSRALALFLDLHATVLRTAGNLEGSRRSEQEALRVAEETGDIELRLAVRLYLPYGYYVAGRLQDGLTTTEAALADARRADLEVVARLKRSDPYLFLLLMKGALLCEAGRFAEAKRILDQLIELARERDEMEILGWAHSWHADLACRSGDRQKALHHARAFIEIAERIGSTFSRVWARIHLGCAHILNEEWSQASDALGQALAMARERRTALEGEARTLVHIAEARLGSGFTSEARAAAEEAIAVARRLGTPLWECDAHRVLARALLRAEGKKSEAQIREALERALSLAEGNGARSREPLIRMEQAALARALGDDVTCRRELREAHRLFTQMGATGHAERLAKELGL